MVELPLTRLQIGLHVNSAFVAQHACPLRFVLSRVSAQLSIAIACRIITPLLHLANDAVEICGSRDHLEVISTSESYNVLSAIRMLFRVVHVRQITHRTLVALRILWMRGTEGVENLAHLGK